VPGIKNAGVAVGLVALGADAFIPVMVGGSTGLQLDLLGPGVLPRRLIEMTVDAEEFIHAHAPFFKTLSLLRKEFNSYCQWKYLFFLTGSDTLIFA